MPKLYRHALSGHSHRAQLFLSSLGEEAELADVGGYSDIAHAPEGGVDLEPFPAVHAWLERIEALPGFVPMQKTVV